LVAGAAGQFSRRRFKKAICSSGDILFSNLLVALRQRRDDATASKLFFFVAMDEEGWSHNVHRRVPLQHIHRVEIGFPAGVG